MAEDEREYSGLDCLYPAICRNEVVAVGNGEEAWQSAPAEMLIILMDVRMPRMTGYEACERIKADERIRHIPGGFPFRQGQESEIALVLRCHGIFTETICSRWKVNPAGSRTVESPQETEVK